MANGPQYIEAGVLYPGSWPAAGLQQEPAAAQPAKHRAVRADQPLSGEVQMPRGYDFVEQLETAATLVAVARDKRAIKTGKAQAYTGHPEEVWTAGGASLIERLEP